MGEYAQMLRGERWMKMNKSNGIDNAKWSLTVILNKNYDHRSKYTLPAKYTLNDDRSFYLE